MLETPARSEEVRAILEGVDDTVIESIVDTGASMDEVGEAMHLLVDRGTVGETATTGRVVRVCAILRDARR
jgi:hypothetical protein